MIPLFFANLGIDSRLFKIFQGIDGCSQQSSRPLMIGPWAGQVLWDAGVPCLYYESTVYNQDCWSSP
jgi:hypothetical protein